MSDDQSVSVGEGNGQELGALIVSIARTQDRTAFAELFGHFAPRVKAYFIRQRMDRQSAEDLAQEVMLTVWRKAALYDAGKASASTWIFTIARNRMVDQFRRDRRPEPDLEDPSLYPTTPAQADDEMVTSQIGERVREAMRSLPEEQAEVVELSFVEGLAHAAIAERLSLPLGTVKSRLRLAFGRLRPILEELK